MRLKKKHENIQKVHFKRHPKGYAWKKKRRDYGNKRK